MKKIIPILLAVVLFASLTHAFTSPPKLLDKLDEMFSWTKENMGVQNAVRPPVFISSPSIFKSICISYEDEETAYECDETLGIYDFDGVIHILRTPDAYRIEMDKTIIHEMVHALQHTKHGYEFMAEDNNDELLQKEADLISNAYISKKYHIYTRR